MLPASHVRVYDSAGLIDRMVARTLQQGNLAGFHDYIFDDARPTFIDVRQWTTAQTRLAEDPCFARDYAPICEYSDPWVAEYLGEAMLSGKYVGGRPLPGWRAISLPSAGRGGLPGLTGGRRDRCGIGLSGWPS